MPVPERWDAGTVVAGSPVVAWQGRVWRMHKRRYRADDPGGARKVSGRYNRGLDRFEEEGSFPALYLATAPEICLGEVYRHITPELLPALNDFRLSELSVEVGEVLDCRSPKPLGLSLEHLVHDTDYEATQAIGAAALEGGLEGLIVPSAIRLGDNLI
ncbi:MAG: RES family NAD+ phosphorylase, partial [Actinomycetota bacterium]|nr:RES family NAD+ phosphorylase [Actinomycetota bacterium]